MAKQFIKVGTVQRKKDGHGTSVKLGLYNKSRPENTITVTVTNPAGDVVAQVENPYLLVQDPRLDHKGNPTKFADKVPDFILHELTLISED
jgi:hypothetical protein